MRCFNLRSTALGTPRVALVLGGLTLGGAAFGAAKGNPDPAKLLIEADRSRGHCAMGLEYQVALSCTQEDASVVSRTYQVRSRGESAKAVAVAPPDRKGDIYLVNGVYIWDLRTTSDQPVAVTLQDRLTSLASVGDIVAMGFSAIYNGTVTGTETIDGDEAFVLDLKSKPARPATYESAMIWISKKTKLALKAQFLALDRKPVKTVTYDYQAKLKIDGKEVPFVTGSKIVDPMQSCTMTYSGAKSATVDKKEFDLKAILAARPAKPGG